MQQHHLGSANNDVRHPVTPHPNLPEFGVELAQRHRCVETEQAEQRKGLVPVIALACRQRGDVFADSSPRAER